MKDSEEAEELNNTLKERAPHVYSLLSDFGKKAYSPRGSILAQSAEAEGTSINATIGQALEDDGDAMVLDSLANQVKLSPTVFLYSNNYGQRELRELWQKWILENNPSIKTTISMPIVTNGLTNGVFTANKLFVNKGDKVIIPDIVWGNYKLLFQDGDLDEYPLFVQNGFNVSGLEEKLSGSDGKKVVVLNFPHNPTGYTPTEREAEEIVEAIKCCADRGNNVAVICDDAYFDLVYEQGLFTESIFAKLANLHERVLAIKVDGISKEAYAWGLRVGFITYGFKGMSEETSFALENKSACVIRVSVSNICRLSQSIAINALKSPDFLKQKKMKYEKLKERYEAVKESLEKNPQYKEFFEPLPFNSGYYVCVKLKKNDASQIREKLIKEFSTGVIVLGDLLRIAYSSVGKEKIPQLFENIYKACKINI